MSIQNKKRILITGASGFIGGFLVKEALDRGFYVTAGVRASSDKSNLQDERISFLDLRYDDEEVLACQLAYNKQEHGAWDYVIHNAGLTKTNDKKNFYKVNAQYTQNLIKALHIADNEPKKFLLMSSLSTFSVTKEKELNPILLTDPQVPVTKYGKSKLQAEDALREQTFFPYIILRPTGVYGPGERDYFMEIKSIKHGFDFAVGMDAQHITFIYVKDLAKGALMALEKPEIMNKEYFVADGDVYTDEAFARIIQKILKKKFVFHARIPLGLVHIACKASEGVGKLFNKAMTLNSDKYYILKQRNWICDITPFQEEVGFEPEYPLREGLEETIAWYKEKGWL